MATKNISERKLINQRFVEMRGFAKSGTRVEVRDANSGLILVVGVKSKKFYCVVNRRRIPLGSFPLTSVDDARKAMSDAMRQHDLYTGKTSYHKATVREYIKTVYSKVKGNTTIKMLMSAFDDHLLEVKMGQLTKYHIDQWKVRASQVVERNKKIRQPSTLKRYYNQLRAMFNYAVEVKHILESNINNVKFEGVEKNPLPKYMEKETYQLYFRCMKKSDSPILESLATIMIYSGMRPSEVLAITISGIDWGNKKIQVAANVNKIKKMQWREVPQVVLDEIRKYIDLRYIDNEDQYVFFNQKTGDRYKTVKTAWNSLVKKNGLPRYRLYDLRHTFATEKIIAGESAEVVGKIMGHCDKTTAAKNYLHIMDKARRESADRTERIIKLQ